MPFCVCNIYEYTCTRCTFVQVVSRRSRVYSTSNRSENEFIQDVRRFCANCFTYISRELHVIRVISFKTRGFELNVDVFLEKSIKKKPPP